jgi:hypothetical protein
MSTKMMEEQIADLHLRVKKLEAAAQPAPSARWREAIGFANGDDLFDEAMKLGAEWRERANREGS